MKSAQYKADISARTKVYFEYKLGEAIFGVNPVDDPITINKDKSYSFSHQGLDYIIHDRKTLIDVIIAISKIGDELKVFKCGNGHGIDMQLKYIEYRALTYGLVIHIEAMEDQVTLDGRVIDINNLEQELNTALDNGEHEPYLVTPDIVDVVRVHIADCINWCEILTAMNKANRTQKQVITSRRSDWTIGLDHLHAYQSAIDCDEIGPQMSQLIQQ